MYPVLFRIGGFEITSFGVMVALAALTGLWVFRRELAVSRLPDGAADGALMGVMGGLAGAKLLWVAEHAGEEPLASLLLSRGGLSWFGGLAGGVVTALIFFVIRKYPLVDTVSAATPALCIGHAIGRIGCFLVGDDYGQPTSLPWGVAFPEGLPPTTARVHPTQLYEAALLALLAVLLVRWRRRGVSSHTVLGRYLLLAGLVRFAIEFLRVDQRVFFGLSVAHLAAVAMMGLSVAFLGRGAGRGSEVVGRGRRARP